MMRGEGRPIRLALKRAWTSSGKSAATALQLIDSAWYLATYPDVANSGIPAADHYMSTGWAEGRWPNLLFDTEWYLARNPDIELSGIHPLAHFFQQGWRENRNPHPLFDTKWYLETYEDVAASGINPLLHFLSSGSQEGRSPHPLFSAAWYSERYPDVVRAGIAPLTHYLGTGWREGRRPSPLFDPGWYLAAYPAIAASGMEPLSHFVAAGAAAGHSPHPLFDTAWYASQNPDVVRAQINPVVHYLTTGWREGRSPNPLFEPRWYLDAYPDVAAAGMDPLMHFIASGGAERRRTGPHFHTDWYVATYPEAAAANVNPLQHYLTAGRAKGYHPNALSAAEAAPARLAPAPKAAQTAAPQTARAEPAPPAKTPPTIAKDADSLIEPPCDANGNLLYPRFRRGDGRRLAALRLNRDHLWLDNAPLKEFLDTLDDRPLLPDSIRRILIIGHDFTQKTGVMRSLSHYLSALAAAGGIEITSLQIAQGADAMVVINDTEVHDLVIVNSLVPFFEHSNGIDILRRCGSEKAAIYLHETDFVFDKLQAKFPEQYEAFAAAAPEFNFLTVSGQQEDMLRRRFGANRTFRVHETSPVALLRPALAARSLDAGRPLKIVMAGTLQPRKGVSLFSKVADLAASEGRPWKFLWAGGEVGLSEGLYRSWNVNFVGNLDGAGIAEFIANADVFLLSSEDDPFPLACLEALQMQKRTVVYRGTGTSEIVRTLPGCAVYGEYTPEAAFSALKAAIASEFDEVKCQNLNRQFALRGFADGFFRAVAGFYKPRRLLPDWKPARAPRIAAIVHLFYHDLWHEIASHLESLRHWSPDLYVTLTTDKPPAEIDRQRAAILKRWPGATILEVPNQGMDIGPFVEVARHINANKISYELIVKVHSKKSLSASGADYGNAWRRQLLDGLLGSPGNVDRIISIFSDYSHIGMIGPKGLLMGKSSHDLAAGYDLNATNMQRLGKRMGLSDVEQRFFRGTMFWMRAHPALHAIQRGDLKITDFEPGHQPDVSNAHAMERLFACMVRSDGKHLFEIDSELPKPISLLRNRHAGEDIYIIAAGASAGLVDPKFFEGKTTIGVNRVFVRFPCTYAIFKEFANAEYEQELLQSGAIPITAQWDSGNIRQGKMRRNLMIFKRPEYYYYAHLENTREVVDLSVIKPDSDRLVVSYSTITSAMHLAAYMGARNIILVGHDCGLLDGKAVFDGYYKDMSVSPWKNSAAYAEWLGQIEAQTLAVRDAVREQFGTPVISLNPFVNLGLEGHKYER